MNYECPHCKKKLQNPQALKMHIKWKHSEEAIQPLEAKADTSDADSVAPVSESAEDLEIEEPEHENPFENSEEEGNQCPLCKAKLEDFENPCKKCGAEITWSK